MIRSGENNNGVFGVIVHPHHRPPGRKVGIGQQKPIVDALRAHYIT
jgi:hypothetical protein